MWIRKTQTIVVATVVMIGLVSLARPAVAAKPDKKTVAAAAPPLAAVAATQPCCGMCSCAGVGAKQAAATIPPSTPAPAVAATATPNTAVAAKQPATLPTPMRGQGYGMMRGRGMGPGAGMGGPGNMREVMGVFHQLLTDHAQIQRTVQEVNHGVVTVTTSQNPVVTALIRTHVAQMKSRLEKGQPVRRWDPLFVEIFKNADKIDLKIDEVAGGVRVTETTEDPQVVPLIRQHAQAVSEFVARGWDRAHEATPLPEGYPTGKPAAAPAKGNNVK
jgi:hypothetical protein